MSHSNDASDEKTKASTPITRPRLDKVLDEKFGTPHYMSYPDRTPNKEIKTARYMSRFDGIANGKTGNKTRTPKNLRATPQSFKLQNNT
jgi:hypothetical protein